MKRAQAPRKCPECGCPLTAFTTLDGSRPPAPRPGDPIACYPNGCGLIWTLREDGSVREYSAAEQEAMARFLRAKIAEARRV